MSIGLWEALSLEKPGASGWRTPEAAAGVSLRPAPVPCLNLEDP